jgi:biotin synthase
VSNVCIKDCNYCGLRSDRATLPRYTLSLDEIVATAKYAEMRGLGSIVLQAGERQDEPWIQLIEKALFALHRATGNRLHVTLSLGEQTTDTYRRWKLAGAHRYLLRIETSNEQLYRAWHPEDHDFGARLRCLSALREIGYQVGTGVLIGAPGQTIEHLADDLLFFRDLDIDMIGMGPYVVHRETPLGENAADGDGDRAVRVTLMLRMISLARLMLRDVNIASTTALATLRPDGREQGLLAGANVVMPNLTPAIHRGDYELYEGKPVCENSVDDLALRAESIGERIGWRAWGDPLHAVRRQDRDCAATAMS